LDRFTGVPRLRHPGAGQAVALARGDLRWRMAVPVDGILPLDNLFPALIEWQGAAHPAARLTPSGARLSRLVVTHPEAAILRATVGAELRDARVVFEPGPTGLRAEIETPHGPRVIE
ncbi:MAG: VOC family protein, partial [Roseovarius sp.]|nr:VOC family protein [Roseovarius sp.]